MFFSTILVLGQLIINLLIIELTNGLVRDFTINISNIILYFIIYQYIIKKYKHYDRFKKTIPYSVNQESPINKERWYLYFLLQNVVLIPVDELGDRAYFIAVMTAMIISIILLKPLFQESKTNNIIKPTIKVMFMIFILNATSSFIMTEVLSDYNLVNNNEELIASLLEEIPFKMIIDGTLLAAFNEEVWYRGFWFRQILPKSKFLAYLLTFFLFGIPHIIPDIFAQEYLSALVNLPIYGIMGMLFAYAYQKTNSIYTPMLVHFLNNSLAFYALLSI